MSEIIYLNGSFLNQKDAKISVFDRGFLFGDGVYEVVPVIDGVIIEIEPFFERFERSLHEIGLFLPLSKDKFLQMLQSLVLKNNLKEVVSIHKLQEVLHLENLLFQKILCQLRWLFVLKKRLSITQKQKVA